MKACTDSCGEPATFVFVINRIGREDTSFSKNSVPIHQTTRRTVQACSHTLQVLLNLFFTSCFYLAGSYNPVFLGYSFLGHSISVRCRFSNNTQHVSRTRSELHTKFIFYPNKVTPQSNNLFWCSTL
jgi:hypothetical protein